MNEREERRYFNPEITLESRAKDDGTKENIISGYGIVWDSESRVLGGWSPFVETISRNALEGVDLTEVVATVNHDFNNILARCDSGTLKLTQDAKGLKYEFAAPDTSYARDLIENLVKKNIRGSSFIFTTSEDRWTFSKDQDKPDKREVLKIERLIELGPVTMPAYPETTAAKRSYDSAIEAEKPKVDYADLEQRGIDFLSKRQTKKG